jgi:hypothetical protein
LSKKAMEEQLAQLEAAGIKMAGSKRKGRAALAQALTYWWVQDMLIEGIHLAVHGHLPGETEA